MILLLFEFVQVVIDKLKKGVFEFIMMILRLLAFWYTVHIFIIISFVSKRTKVNFQLKWLLIIFFVNIRWTLLNLVWVRSPSHEGCIIISFLVHLIFVIMIVIFIRLIEIILISWLLDWSLWRVVLIERCLFKHLSN